MRKCAAHTYAAHLCRTLVRGVLAVVARDCRTHPGNIEVNKANLPESGCNGMRVAGSNGRTAH